MTSNKSYHAQKAISHSFICNIMKNGMYPAFIESCFNPNYSETEPTDALEQGQLYHTLMANKSIAETIYENGVDGCTEIPVCLNPDAKNPVYNPCYIIPVDDYTVIFVFDYGMSRQNVKYTTLVQMLKNSSQWTEDAIVVNMKELISIATMVHTIQHLPVYMSLFENKEIVAKEEPIFYEYQGNKYKIKPDVILKDAKGDYYIVDYKTTRLTNREDMQKEGEKQGYHIQDCMYKRGVALHYNVDPNKVHMVFLMQNKTPEYNGLICYAFIFEKYSMSWADTIISSIVDDFMFRYKSSDNGNTSTSFIDLTPNLYTFSHYEPRLDVCEAAL